ncbi:hypothetical protein PtB15_4B456 [Puccinia triticina]|nr:hypothetical protein PtB15_4B456 [Puccinia triticina]
MRKAEGSVGLEFVLASIDGEQLGLLDPPKETSRRPAELAPRPRTGSAGAQQKGKERATPASSRVHSSTRSSINPGPRIARPPNPDTDAPPGRPKLVHPPPPPPSPDDSSNVTEMRRTTSSTRCPPMPGPKSNKMLSPSPMNA